MIVPLPSNNRRFGILVGIRALIPFALGIRAYDPTKPNTDYIRRRIPFHPGWFDADGEAYREFTLPFPISGQMMMVELYDKATRNDNTFVLERFELKPLEDAEIWAEPEIHRFVDFTQEFAQKAGYISPGSYDSKDGEFLIQYLPVIRNELGMPLVTPARTNRLSGRIQASQSDFVRYTVPVRMVVLFHERYHYQIPTRLEKPADLNAIRLYLDLGYPRTEAVYATSKIFLSHPDTTGPAHARRVKDVRDFIDQYSARKELKMHA